MNAPRHIRVIAALTRARGGWVTGHLLSAELGLGRQQICAAVSEARAAGTVVIESHPTRGGGWRIPRAAPPLSKAAATILELLQQAGGEFVAGRVLAGAIDKPMESLPTYTGELRRKMPDLRVEGRHGQGYRIGALATTADLPPSPPAGPMSARDRQRTAIELLGELHPGLAERVRTVALEAGETASETIYRLIDYGVEVHHSLIVAGEHPLQLGRAA